MADQQLEGPYKTFPQQAQDKTPYSGYTPPTYPAQVQTTQQGVADGVYPQQPLPAGTIVTDYPAPGFPMATSHTVYPPPPTMMSGGVQPQLQSGAPPSYTYTTGYPPQPSSTANVTVIKQPAVKNVITDSQSGPVPDSYFVVSALMCFFCFCFGNWLTFICIIPALIFSSISDDRASSEDFIGARMMGRAALICNISAIVFYVISAVIVIIVAVAVTVVRRNQVQCTLSSYYYDPVSGDIRARCL